MTLGTELAVAEDCFVVRVRGSLDGAGAPVVGRALAGALTTGRAVSVDLSGVEQFDDDGLDALASAGTAAARQRLVLVILNIEPELRRVLEAHHRGDGLALEGAGPEGCRPALLLVCAS